MSTITESVDVNAPLSAVYNQWTQFEEFPEFMEAWNRSGRPTTSICGGRSRSGLLCVSSMPRSPSSTPTDHAGVITFHRLDETTTRVTAQMDIDPEGFVETAADKLGVLGHRIKADMRRFQQLMESRSDETGAWRGDIERPNP